jgi:hypothetical protein
MPKKITKSFAIFTLAFLGFSQTALAFTEITGTLSSAKSTDSVSEYQDAQNSGNQSATQSSGSSGGSSSSGTRRGSSSGTSSAGGTSNGTSNGDIIIYIDNPNEGLTGTGGGYDPALENFLASQSKGRGGAASNDDSESVSNVSTNEDLLALNQGAAVPEYLGGDQSAATASTRLGTGTIALIAIGTIALVAAIGYGVNSALGMRQNDRL